MGRDALPPPAPEETELAILVACKHRGALRHGDLTQLLSIDAPVAPVDGLVAAGHLAATGDRFEITQAGREHLDRIVESIEASLTPDAPEHERRFRQEDASLPLAANTIWAEAVCVNVAVDPVALRPLIPDVFELDLHDGRAWVSLTASRLKNFGVAGVPDVFRMNFYQATYRAHVTFTDFRGRVLRGCYFVRSDTNSPVMSLTANLLPEFRDHRCGTYPMIMVQDGDHFVLSVDSGDDPAGKVVLVLDLGQPVSGMPARSRFRDLPTAYEFLVDFYDAFAWNPPEREVFILRIERGDWDVKVYEPVDAWLGYFADGPFAGTPVQVDSVFYFRDCPYVWLPLLKERVRLDQK